MNRRSDAGFTLLEILLVLGILAGFLLSLESVVQNAAAAVARTNECAREVSGLHRALRFLEPDLRGAEEVRTLPTGEVRVRRDGEGIAYVLDRGVLLRRSPQGTERLARGLSSFTVAEEGGLLRVTLGLPPRAGVTALVAPRVAGAGR